MSTFVMLTRLTDNSDHARDPRELKRRVLEEIRDREPAVRWLASYAIFGPYDYLDIFEAPNVEVAEWISMTMNSLAKARTELWPASEWNDFKQMLDELPRQLSTSWAAMLGATRSHW